MLVSLHISNIVLIEKLNLQFGNGLNIMTGETGAGKSILLDALSLALGARSDTGLIRNGCDMSSVSAEFDFINDTTKEILDENGIDYSEGLILRRTLSRDGKSKAWINDALEMVDSTIQCSSAAMQTLCVCATSIMLT